MPVPTALNPSQGVSFTSGKPKRAHQQYHSRRSALAPLAKSSSAAMETFTFGLPADHMSIATVGHNYGRLGRGRAVVDDENAPFDAQYAYGGPHYSSSKHQSFAQGVIGQHSLGGIPAVSGLHVLPDATSHRDHHRRHQHSNHRHSLSGWPPSPHGFPPTPTFEDDAYHAPISDAKFTNDSANVWPSAPAPNERTFSESSLISGGGASYHVSIAPESDPDSTLTGETYSPAPDDAPAKLVPSPSELLRIANEQARANAATNLSDWVSEVVWEMCIPLMGGYHSSSPNSTSLRRSASLSANTLVPPPFKRFAQQTIYQVSASAGSLFLAIWYIGRLPIGPAYSALGEKIAFGDKERAFRDDLLAMRSEIPWRLLVLGLTLSNKWLEDNTFTTKTWNEVTGLSVPLMKSIETKALGLFEWVLSPRPEEWLEFLQQLRNREVANNILALPSAIGSERRSSLSMSSSFSESSPGKRPIRVIDELMAEVRATAAAFDPVFPGVSPTLSPSGSGTLPSPISPASSLAESFGTVSSVRSQPRPLSPPHVEDTWRARPASWTELRHDLSAEEVPQHLPRAISDEMVARFGILPRRINTPAAWDPSASALDSPIVREEAMSRKTRPTYEAVQRPSSLLLIPPPPRFDDYSNASFIPRAKYEEMKDTIMDDQDGPYAPQPFPEHYESNGMDRSWYDAKFARNMIPTETHGSSWATTFAGMISSF